MTHMPVLVAPDDEFHYPGHSPPGGGMAQRADRRCETGQKPSKMLGYFWKTDSRWTIAVVLT
jgi:hypothetical protein